MESSLNIALRHILLNQSMLMELLADLAEDSLGTNRVTQIREQADVAFKQVGYLLELDAATPEPRRRGWL